MLPVLTLFCWLFIELIAVGQNSSGLTLLHEIVMSKRSRSTPLTALEPIMLKFVELCVALRKGKVAKEGLHQYKNISQNITVTTIEVSSVSGIIALISMENAFCLYIFARSGGYQAFH